MMTGVGSFFGLRSPLPEISADEASNDGDLTIKDEVTMAERETKEMAAIDDIQESLKVESDKDEGDEDEDEDEEPGDDELWTR
jgi:hypothetical protein